MIRVKLCYFAAVDEQSLPEQLLLRLLPQLRLLLVVELLVAELEPAAVVVAGVTDFGYEIGRLCGELE